jgi:ferritin-like metal-binding protein YciE
MKKVVNKLTGGPGQIPNQPFPAMLSSLLYTERQLCEMLPKLIIEASDPELKRGLQEHLEQTRQHVANVERMFQAFDARPTAEPSPALDGLERSHVELSAKTPDPLKDLVVASAAAAGEHHEIAMYEALREMAGAVGKREVVALIDQNLDQERHALQVAEQATHRLASAHAGELTS